tara:strand:- start:6658 stop:6819 length:162 start_codon:yes stop_codon:yes gene_type:complete
MYPVSPFSSSPASSGCDGAWTLFINTPYTSPRCAPQGVSFSRPLGPASQGVAD